MKITRCTLLLLLALLAAPAGADEMHAGVELSAYPRLVLVPSFPVYYAPDVAANYFFYDGDFWLFDDNHWYRSPWYDGPWNRVAHDDVPDIILQVPIRYYVRPPAFFFDWYMFGPPHWGEHWGHDWERRHHDWDKRDRRLYGEPAPLPDYQRGFSGNRYPRAPGRQNELREQNYRYRSRAPYLLQSHPVPPPGGRREGYRGEEQERRGGR